ncbi:GTPase HflX [bacterium]|nr:GTPase HflX [bacterium]
MSEVQGNLSGLKPSEKKALEKLLQRKNGQDIITAELARTLTELSRSLGRQIGILCDRKGQVLTVIVGDAKTIMIDDLKRFRVGRSRFRGVRFLHTHLTDEALTQDDLTDLALLRFDTIMAIQALPSGLPGLIHLGWLVPSQPGELPWHTETIASVHELYLDFPEFIHQLEREFAEHSQASRAVKEGKRRAILIGVTTGRLSQLEQSMAELTELAISAGLTIVRTVTQHRQALNPKYVVGTGKLTELMITAMQEDAEVIVFEGELSGSQMRAIAEFAEIEVIDRTQLILDIFAKRAHSRDGKLQVELAQLKYSLPRLVLKDNYLSRITGGIGAKGPGETKLEIWRRRIKDRIAILEKELDGISQQRKLRRSQRVSSSLCNVNLVGYTNAGKSTLLNTLTGADVFVENRMFATLDPTSRRLRLPSGSTVIITDTVGFIQDLPNDLAKAFRATLEELNDADLLIHVVDASNPRYADQIMAVTSIEEELALDSIPQLLVFNKTDLVSPETLQSIAERWPEALLVSALDASSLPPLLQAISRWANQQQQGNG